MSDTGDPRQNDGDLPATGRASHLSLTQDEVPFRLLVESVRDYAIFMLDPDGYIRSWNTGARHIKGYTADEIIGHHFSIFYTADALARRHPWYELEVAEREGRFEEEGWRIRKDGTRFWANVVITAVRDEMGLLVGFAKVTRDLTERQSLRADQERLQLLVDSVQDYAIFLLDPDGHILTWNRGAQRIKGYTPVQVIGRHFSVFYTPDAQERRHPQWELEEAAREGRYEEEGWRVRADGDLFWANVVITALRNPRDELVGFAKITRDLTARKQAEESLRENEERLTRIVASATDAIISTDDTGRILVFNRAAERLLGVPADRAIGGPLDRFIPPGALPTTSVQAGPASDAGLTLHSMPGALQAVRADGTRVPVESTVSQAMVGGQRVFTVVLRDVTERLRTEVERARALRQAEEARAAAEEANLTKSGFMATMSHELRTPLNAMLGYTDLLLMGVPEPLPEGSVTHVERLRLSARHLLQLIEEMLSFARLEAGKEEVDLQPVPLADVLREVAAIVEPLAEGKGIVFRAEVRDVPHTLHTDPRKLRQVLLNLLGNAVKFTEQGHVELRVEGGDPWLTFRVTDTGVGIPPGHRERLFEAFWQGDGTLNRTAEGTGLGLAIAERYVRMLGGEIRVESVVGEGSTFTVRLPAEGERVSG
ncbi:MAG TPA: PAS domain S-box protein [Longimicrobium sp.]|nr:PAS domain S-box protein [Longimicrobium sp.]